MLNQQFEYEREIHEGRHVIVMINLSRLSGKGDKEVMKKAHHSK